MSQNDLVIANQSAPDFRADLNDALQALGSLNSGSTAPSTTYANMLWYDTSNNILKMRSEADDTWIDIGTLNQSTNEFEVANLTELTETQAEDDTSTVFGLVSGERLAESFAANEQQIGVGQTWQDVRASRSSGVSYQNTTGKPIAVSISGFGGFGKINVSSDGITWYEIGALGQSSQYYVANTFIVPNGHYYRQQSGALASVWMELR